MRRALNEAIFTSVFEALDRNDGIVWMASWLTVFINSGVFAEIDNAAAAAELTTRTGVSISVRGI